MSESTTQVPAEAIEAAAHAAFAAAYPRWTWDAMTLSAQAAWLRDAEIALVAAAPALLAAERDRVALAIKQYADAEASRTEWDGAPGLLGNWVNGIRDAARIARTPRATETVTYDGFGAPIVHTTQGGADHV
jgi:hypothetical protein